MQPHKEPCAHTAPGDNTLNSEYLLDPKCQRHMYKGIILAKNLPNCSCLFPSSCGRGPRWFPECQHRDIHTTENQHFHSLSYFALSYLSTTVWFVFVTTAVPEVALDRSVNLESNAFMGSIFDGVVNTEEDDAGGAAEAEVAFRLSIRDRKTRTEWNLLLVTCPAQN